MSKKHVMSYDVSDIRSYMNQNNIDNSLDINNPIKSLGIFQINVKENLWTIKMKAPQNSLYKNGVFTITLDFPQSFPNSRPEVRIQNKIYHLQVNPNNGHICTSFLNQWQPNTTIKEVLVGIYLFFIYGQNPDSPYSGTMARQYVQNCQEFNKIAEEYVKNYATQSVNDLLLIEKMENFKLFQKNEDFERKIGLLTEQVQKLENELTQVKKQLLEINNMNNYKDKYIQLLEELNQIKRRCPFELLPGENLISIIFQSSKKDILCSIIVKDSDIFAIAENALYAKYPSLKESENSFKVNGNLINKAKSLRDNNIKDSDLIQIN